MNQSNEEKIIIEKFANYVIDNDPDIIFCLNDSDVSRVFQNLFQRVEALELENIHFGRERLTSHAPIHQPLIVGRVVITSNFSSSGDATSLVELVEGSSFSYLPLEFVSKYGPGRSIDSRNCYELIQRGFVIPQKKNSSTNHEQIRTVEDIVEKDKGGMIVSPQIGLHENVVASRF